mgnify:CR=1 FL=1
MAIQDDAKQFFLTELSRSQGDLPSLQLEWLASEGYTRGSIDERWSYYLRDNGQPPTGVSWDLLGLTRNKGGGVPPDLRIFANGESGFLYDFSRPDGLMTLANGPTQVAADADPIGLVFDRKSWRNKARLAVEANAAELIPNPTMVGGGVGVLPTGWAFQPGAGITRTVVGVGEDSFGHYVDIKFAGTNSSGGIVYPAVFLQPSTSAEVSLNRVYLSKIRLTLVDGVFSGASSHRYTYNEFNSGGRYLRTTSGGVIDITESGAEYKNYVIFGASTVYAQAVLTFTIQNGSSVDFTFRIHTPSSKQIPGLVATGSGSTRPFWYTAGYGRGDGVDDNLLTTFTPAAVGNTIMARVTVPASIAALVYPMGVFNTSNNARFLIGFTKSRRLFYGVGTTGSSDSATDYGGQTMTIAVVDKGGTAECYVNGAFAHSYSTSGNVPAIPMALFALNFQTSVRANFWSRDIYKALAIDRALTPTEILNIHNQWSA